MILLSLEVPAWRVLSVFALAVVAASLATPSAAAEQTASIGALTLNFDDAEWSVDGNTIRCISDNCLGAVVDVTITDGLEFCTRDVGYAEAARAFPQADRHAVNVHNVNGLSLVFGQSRISENPEGWAVYACATRDGVRYEFTSRIDEPPTRLQHGAIFEMLLGLVAPTPTTTELRVGAFVTALPSDRWRIADHISEDGRATLTCLPPYCDAPVSVFLTVTPVDPDQPNPCVPDPDTGIINMTPTAEGGPAFTLQTLHSMCRAWTPPVLQACAVYEGQRYFLGTGALTGCNFGPAVAPDLFADLVGAFRLAE